MAEQPVHYLGDSHNDIAFCGRDQLGGGITDLTKVTCVDCLKSLVAYGLAARDRLRQITCAFCHKVDCDCH